MVYVSDVLSYSRLNRWVIANALELRLSCTNPSKWFIALQMNIVSSSQALHVDIYVSVCYFRL